MITTSTDAIRRDGSLLQNISGINRTNNGFKKAGKYDGWLLLLLSAILIEGILYDWLTPMIVNRQALVFRLTPYMLYPTDLYLFPITIFLMLIATRKTGVSNDKSRFSLLLVWWCICILGVVNGYFNHNTNLPADVRNLVVRPLIAIAVFRLSLEANIVRVLDRFIKLSVLFSIVLIARRISFFFSVDISSFPMGGWGVHVLLLPYSILLMQIGTGEKHDFRWSLSLVLIGLGILQEFWKPVVVGFLLMHAIAVAFLIQRRNQTPSHRSKENILRIISGLVVIVMLFGLVFLSNAYYLDLFKIRYLKESASVRDLSGNRFQIWSHAMTIWRENPFLGTGFGRLLQGFLINPGLGVSTYLDVYYVHSISLQILYQLGIVAFVIYLFLIMKWFFLTNESSLKIQSSPQYGLYKGIVLFIIVAFYIAQLGESMNNSVAGMIFWVALGLEASIASRFNAKP